MAMLDGRELEGREGGGGSRSKEGRTELGACLSRRERGMLV